MTLAAEIAALPLVDHHCHGVVLDPLDRAGFEGLLTEAHAPGRAGTTTTGSASSSASA